MEDTIISSEDYNYISADGIDMSRQLAVYRCRAKLYRKSGNHKEAARDLVKANFLRP